MSQLAMDDDKILALLEQNKAMIGDRDPILESVHADLGRPTVDDNWEDVMKDGAVDLAALERLNFGLPQSPQASYEPYANSPVVKDFEELNRSSHDGASTENNQGAAVVALARWCCAQSPHTWAGLPRYVATHSASATLMAWHVMHLPGSSADRVAPAAAAFCVEVLRAALSLLCYVAARAAIPQPASSANSSSSSSFNVQWSKLLEPPGSGSEAARLGGAAATSAAAGCFLWGACGRLDVALLACCWEARHAIAGAIASIVVTVDNKGDGDSGGNSNNSSSHRLSASRWCGVFMLACGLAIVAKANRMGAAAAARLRESATVAASLETVEWQARHHSGFGLALAAACLQACAAVHAEGPPVCGTTRGRAAATASGVGAGPDGSSGSGGFWGGSGLGGNSHNGWGATHGRAEAWSWELRRSVIGALLCAALAIVETGGQPLRGLSRDVIASSLLFAVQDVFAMVLVLGDNQFTGESCLPNLRACRGQAGAVAMALVVFFAALFLGAEGFSPTFLVGASLCAYGSLLFGGHALPYALLASSEDGSDGISSEPLS